MKRIISIFCICTLVLGVFQIAYAGAGKVKDNANSSANTNASTNANENENSSINANENAIANTNENANANDKGNKNTNFNAATKEDVEALNEQINQNNEEIIKLREEMSSLTVSIKSKVAKLSSGKTAITQAKAADLLTVTSIIKSSKKGLLGFKGDGFKQSISASKIAKENKEFDKARNDINKALELQKKRIKTLNSVINDLKKAEELL